MIFFLFSKKHFWCVMFFKIDFMSIICGTLYVPHIFYMFLYTFMLYYLRNMFDIISAMLYCRLVFQLSHSCFWVQKYSAIILYVEQHNYTLLKAIQHFNFYRQNFKRTFLYIFFFYIFIYPCLSFSYNNRIIFQCFKFFFSFLFCAIECVGISAVDIRELLMSFQ